MIFIILFLVILMCTIVAIMRSGKPLKHIMSEVKLEIIYNLLGGKALIEDFLMKKKNKTELPNKNGQIALVTGGTRGIGVEIVKMLMQCDMHVIIGCRNLEAGKKLETAIRSESIKTGELKCYELDTGSMQSVRSFSQKIMENYSKIHILVNNAGIMFGPYEETKDNFESQFAVNYLGHFLLTHLLLPLIKEAGFNSDVNARIVNVSSIAHFAGEINFEDIHAKTQYIPSKCYAQSKLAQVLSTNYLQTIFNTEKYPIQIHSVHPGVVNTDLFNGTPIKTIFPWLPGLLFKDPLKGAISIVYACVSPKLEGKGGTYISNCRITKSLDKSNSIEIQEKLFQTTKDMLKIQDFGILELNSNL